MLDELSVGNLALIAEARIEPGEGLVVITGETGTGKTLLLGALRLLKGEPAAREFIGPAGTEVTVEGRFVGDPEEIVLTRRVTGTRSRAYLNGDMVPARRLAEVAAGRIEIVGQHDHLELSDPAALRSMLDASLNRKEAVALEAYREAWDALEAVRVRVGELGGDKRALEREREMTRFQADEIAQAGFETGDDAVLGERATRLRHAESLAEHLAAADRALAEEGPVAAVEHALRELQMAARVDPSLGSLVEQLSELATLLGDARNGIAGTAASMEGDPAALAEVERRLATMGDLQRKYGEGLDAVLAFGETARERAVVLDDLLERADDLAGELESADRSVAAAGVTLRAKRSTAAKRVSSAARAHLVELGFSDPVIRFDVAEAPPGPNGADKVTLLFSSDSALQAGPVAKVASGGELSRVVLSVRLATTMTNVTTVAFDEVDAGVGGTTALALGTKLAALAVDRQVLVVTHLPQVAAFASEHYVVERRDSVATVRRIDGTSRIEELSRMLAGLPQSERGREHAAELLEMAATRHR